MKKGCTVKSPTKSCFCTTTTKHSANLPNSTETTLRAPGTQSFGAMRPKLKFMVVTKERLVIVKITNKGGQHRSTA